jgi:anthranilate phosphoribosyltransferase
MPFVRYLKTLAGSMDSSAALDEADAHDLFAAMLDGGVPDLELGALLAALWMRGETAAHLVGFHRALASRTFPMEPLEEELRPVVLPAYGGAREWPNLLPLLAMLLQRLNVPVLVHGTLEGGGRVAAAYVLRELGVMPCASVRAAREALHADHLAFVPTGVLSPGLAQVLALKNRLGMRSMAHLAAKLLDPFGDAVLVMGASSAARRECLAEAVLAGGGNALLLASCEGEPVCHPLHRPAIDWITDATRVRLFEAERGPDKPVPGLPAAVDAAATASWIRRGLAGDALLPHPLVNQFACCLYATGYAADMNQAKAIAVVEAGGKASAASLRPRPGVSAGYL